MSLTCLFPLWAMLLAGAPTCPLVMLAVAPHNGAGGRPAGRRVAAPAGTVGQLDQAVLLTEGLEASAHDAFTLDR